MSTGDHGPAYDYGWQARMAGQAYKAHACQDWRDGYNDASEVMAEEQTA